MEPLKKKFPRFAPSSLFPWEKGSLEYPPPLTHLTPPPAGAPTGILLAAVPRDQRSLASAISMLLYNLLGFFLGPFLSGPGIG